MNWFDNLMSIIMSAILALVVVCFGFLAVGHGSMPNYPAMQAFFWLILLSILVSVIVLKWVIGDDR